MYAFEANIEPGLQALSRLLVVIFDLLNNKNFVAIVPWMFPSP
jgi:hypothetical protein